MDALPGTAPAHSGNSVQETVSEGMGANSESFTSFPIWIPFISFSSLIDVPKTYKTMLNSSGESDQSRDQCMIAT